MNHKPAWLGRAPHTLLLLLCLTVGTPGMSEEIGIESVQSYLLDDYYMLDARFVFAFDEEVLTALQEGVQLQIDIQIRLERVRKWLWDPTVKEDIISLILERHPLTDNYLISNLKTGEKKEYYYLDDAIKALGKVDKHSLIDKDILDPESSYAGYIMATLDVETPPGPLRLVTSVTRQWQRTSDWHGWTLK